MEGSPEHKLLVFDFESGTYTDLFDKNRFSDEYWLDQALSKAENGLVTQKYSISDCRLIESSCST